MAPAWAQHDLEWSVYGAVFPDSDSVYLCGSGGSVRYVKNLRREPAHADLETKTYVHVYDLEIIADQGRLIACCGQGRIQFFDLTSHSLVKVTDLGAFGRSLPVAYDCLRDNGYGDAEALEYLEVLLALKPGQVTEKERLNLVAQVLPANYILCCAITGDPRVIAVGAGDGFIHLIDARNGELYDILDAGGSRSVNLQWLCCSGSDGSISALSADGVMLHFRCRSAEKLRFECPPTSTWPRLFRRPAGLV